MARSQQARSVHEQTRAGRSRTHEGDGQKQSQRRRGDGEPCGAAHGARTLMSSHLYPSSALGSVRAPQHLRVRSQPKHGLVGRLLARLGWKTSANRTQHIAGSTCGVLETTLDVRNGAKTTCVHAADLWRTRRHPALHLRMGGR